MTHNDEFIGQLESYLDEYEGSTPLPGAVRDAIRAELPSTRQRPAWWPAQRSIEMNTMVKLGVAAAVLAVAALGYNYVIAPSVGAPHLGDPSPSPTPTPPDLSEGALEPGTFQLTSAGESSPDVIAFPSGSTITVPAGWSGASGFGVFSEEAMVMFWPWAGDLETVYLDPCQWQDGQVEPAVGPTVDDLADALAGQAQRGDPVPVDVSIGGYSGKLVELTVPDDIDLADCDGGEFRSWEGRFHQDPGQVDEIYILDVDGRRLVLDSWYVPTTSEAVKAERRAIIESIQLGHP